MTSDIKQNVIDITNELPEGVRLVAAAKKQTLEHVKEAIDAGIKIIGENYVQEAESLFSDIGHAVKWHFIGHLQKNKVKKAVRVFDMIETLDSVELASEIDRRAAEFGKVMPVLIEVNSGREEQKSGVFPEETVRLAKEILKFKSLRLEGIMTMGPFYGDPENARPYFKVTREVFDKLLSSDMDGADIKYLSMGMTNSYKVALEEGANVVRIGTKIFGDRN